MYPLTLNYLLNSHNKGNKDGYFVRFDKTEIRTTDFNVALNFVLEHKEEINNSTKVLIHARMATHGGSEFVHGWELGGYRCFHNGVMELKDKTIQNDSLDFFKTVTKNKKTVKNIKREIKERTGSGAFFMIGKDTSYIFSKNHDINIHLLNRNIVVFNSNDDVHKFEDVVIDVSNEKVIAFGLEFPSVKTQKIDAKVEFFEDLKMTFENELLTIGKEGVIAVEHLEVYDIYKYAKGKAWDSSKWDYPKEKQKEINEWDYEKDLRYYEGYRGVY